MKKFFKALLGFAATVFVLLVICYGAAVSVLEFSEFARAHTPFEWGAKFNVLVTLSAIAVAGAAVFTVVKTMVDN
jgi:hypothetical protein